MKRKLKYIECKMCGQICAQVGFQSHLSRKHNSSPNEYAQKYGEYRNKKISMENYIGGDFTCLIDGSTFKTNKMLSGYVKRKYKISMMDYVVNYIFNSQIPTCKCGCGHPVRILSSPPYKVEYISGHNSFMNNPMIGKSHSNESKTMMSVSARARVEKFRSIGTPLPMHQKGALSKRGKIYSRKMMEKKCNFYKVKIINDYDECRDKNKYVFQCLCCGETYTQYHNSYFVCRKCNPRIRSQYEEEIIEFLNKYFPNEGIVRNFRKVFCGKSEIDIYIPSKNVGIEFNGLYWHSEISGGKDKYYHINKTKICEQENIRLIQIFEDDWVKNKNLIKKKILHILGMSYSSKKIYARQCQIKLIPKKEKSEFLQFNHIQGDDKSSIALGCYQNDKLVSVMTFGKMSIVKGSKKSDPGEYELNRFCSDNDFICIGMFGKLLKYFIKNFHPTRIITYADLAWSSKTQNIYTSYNFKYNGNTTPGYWYTNDYKHRIHRFQFTKQKLVKMGHDSKKTEWEIMKKLGYDRIWDCGHLKYELSL